MKLEVKIGNEKREIEFSNTKGRHQRRFIEVYPDKENPSKDDLIKFNNFKVKLICDLSNGVITEEVYDDMDSEEINRIWSELLKKISGGSEKN